MTLLQSKLLVFVGSYAEQNEHGIHVYEFDEANGKLTLNNRYDGLKNPTFLNVDADKQRLYCISETVDGEGNKVGEAVSFAIDAEQGSLTELNRQITVDSTTCHIQRDAEGKYLTVTSYHGGFVGLLGIEGDGEIGRLLDVSQHAGSSVNAERQDRPHPHSSFYSPDGRFLFVQDLGLDQIIAYRIDRAADKLIRHHETAVHPGAGPRHFVFHPSAKFAYAINELDSTVTVFRYEAEGGVLSVLQTVSTLPEGYEGDNGCAEIAISKDGRFLYGSNRGHDSIVVYAVTEETGHLQPIQHISVEGGHPRHFALTPAGNCLLVANRDSNNIVLFQVSAVDGKLTSAGTVAQASKPVCVAPVYFMK